MEDFSPSDFTFVEVIDDMNSDMSWLTQEKIQAYARARWRRVRFGKNVMYQARVQITKNSPDKMSILENCLADGANEEFEILCEEIREAEGIPELGTIEFNMWHLQQTLLREDIDAADVAKLHKQLGEHKGWLTKPADRQISVSVSSVAGQQTLTGLDKTNPQDRERVYFSLVAAAS